MPSASEQHPTRHRLRIELWSWSAWLVLAIISYPVVLLIWVTPRAGLLAGLLAGLAVVYTATLGYSGRRGLDRWLLPTIISLAAATLVGLVAAVADRGSASLVSLAVLVLAAELTFIWHFLPWLAHDAEQVDVPHALSLHSRASGTLSRSPVRPALTLVLLLGLLVLGVGAAWSRGEARVPPPTAWIVVIAVLTLALMFVERLAFFERSSRHVRRTSRLLRTLLPRRKLAHGRGRVPVVAHRCARHAPATRQSRGRAAVEAGEGAPRHRPDRR